MESIATGLASLVVLVTTVAAALPAGAVRGHLETLDLPAHLRDRGDGTPLSMFGTYVQPRQLLVYPFFEFYRDHDHEYAPNDLGYGEDVDYRGEYEATEELIFVAYGITRRLAVEVEAAIIQAELERSPEDRSGVPDEIEESGLGDVEGQIRYRWIEEDAGGPGLFSYLETVIPTQDPGSLIGTTDWEFKLGTCVVRGFGFGTVTLRAAVEYDRAEDKGELGELAVEYLRRVSGSWRVYLGVEGTQDEVELIPELQWHASPRVVVKLSNGIGLTSKATDWAPELGVLLSP